MFWKARFCLSTYLSEDEKSVSDTLLKSLLCSEHDDLESELSISLLSEKLDIFLKSDTALIEIWVVKTDLNNDHGQRVGTKKKVGILLLLVEHIDIKPFL